MSHDETLLIISHMLKALGDLSSFIRLGDAGFQGGMQAMSIIQAAFGALEAAVLPPGLFICRTTLEHQFANTIGTVTDMGLPEIISKAGEKGISSHEIEAVTGLPWGKASRLLRLLSGRGVFREVRPDVWAHSRVSKALDSGLSYEEIVKDPIGRYAKGTPTVAWTTYGCEHSSRCSNTMITAFRDDKYKKSYKTNELPFNLAYNTDKSFWEWIETDSDGKRVHSFAKAMEASSTRLYNYSKYPWHELGENAVLVDVGAGTGTATRDIIAQAPNISKAFVQDRDAVIKGAEAYWRQEQSAALESGKVELQAHNFLTPQPVKGANAYFFRYVIHDWSDDDCVTIFKHIHDAADDHSRLLVMDHVVDHNCHDLSDVTTDAVEGAYPPLMPWPLPANGGRAVELESFLDIQMMIGFGGQERTHEQLKAVAAKAGWKAKKVYRLDASKLKITEFVKVSAD